MAPRDYEHEAAAGAVAGRLAEDVVRALLVGPAGSHEATVTGTLRSLFGRGKRASGLAHQNVLVLTSTTVRLFACAGTRTPRAEREVGAWPVTNVRVAARAAEKTTVAEHRGGSVTSRYYVLTLTVPGTERPIELECVRSDSARTTIEALEDATGSPPSKVTARRRAKKRREAT